MSAEIQNSIRRTKITLNSLPFQLRPTQPCSNRLLLSDRVRQSRLNNWLLVCFARVDTRQSPDGNNVQRWWRATSKTNMKQNTKQIKICCLIKVQDIYDLHRAIQWQKIWNAVNRQLKRLGISPKAYYTKTDHSSVGLFTWHWENCRPLLTSSHPTRSQHGKKDDGPVPGFVIEPSPSSRLSTNSDADADRPIRRFQHVREDFQPENMTASLVHLGHCRTSC